MTFAVLRKGEPMSRLINIDDSRNCYIGMDGEYETWNIDPNVIAEAQPEIVRCKDCKYWKHDHTCSEHALVSPMCANEFCSRAERRTDDGD